MTIRRTLTLLLLSTLPFAGRAEPDAPSTRDILGWVELVEFAEPRVQLKAKLDTGATTSSLNALEQERFERDGKAWMRFQIIDPSDAKNRLTMEAPVVRHVRIRRHNGETQRRPVVKIGMCLGRFWQEQQFTLIDRSDFVYQVLVGRNYLSGKIAVDSGATYLGMPDCKQLADRPLKYAPPQ